MKKELTKKEFDNWVESITPSMIRVLEKRHYNPNIAKCQNQTDWLAKLFYEIKQQSPTKQSGI